MNFFKKIILSMTNSNRAKKKVTPYFNFVKKELSSFLLIDTKVPDDVNYNISILIESQPKKYNKLKDKLEELNKDILKHNELVNRLIYINENVSIYNYDNILHNPYILNQDIFDDLILAIEYSKKLKGLPTFCIELNKLQYIINNFK